MRLSVAILAGGRSRRMGRDKALLRIQQAGTLLERQVAIARMLGPEEVLVSCRPNQLPQTPGGVGQVYDDGSAGPLGGLVEVLRAARGDAVLLLAVDLARIQPHFLRQTVARAAIDGSAGAIPRTARGIEPLAGVYPRGALSLAADQLQSGKSLSMQAFARTLHDKGLIRWFDVPIWDTWQLANFNRPTDLHRGVTAR